MRAEGRGGEDRALEGRRVGRESRLEWFAPGLVEMVGARAGKKASASSALEVPCR